MSPLVSVITTVSLDHTQYLGKTRQAIAREKAQIVHPGGALVAGRVGRGVRELLKDHAKDKGAKAYFLGEDFSGSYTSRASGGRGPRFHYRGMKAQFRDLTIGLAGAHQADNAAVSLAVIELLGGRGYAITESAIREGLASARLSGRMEVVADNPEVIVDVGHNPAAGRVLARWLGTLPKKRTALVVGMMGDKDVGGFLKELDGSADLIFLAAPHVARSASLTELERAASSLSTPVRGCASVPEALSQASTFVGSEGRVAVTGSFYTVGEAMEEMKR